MTTSYTTSATETFSMASARYVCSKIAADLRQLQRYYYSPPEQDIVDYATEAAVLAYHGYVDKMTYGFKRAGNWILALEYRFVDNVLQGDDRAGGVYRNANTAGAAFASYLEPSQSWWELTDSRRNEIRNSLPVIRSHAAAPGYAGGYHTVDRSYSASGTGFARSSYRPL